MTMSIRKIHRVSKNLFTLECTECQSFQGSPRKSSAVSIIRAGVFLEIYVDPSCAIECRPTCMRIENASQIPYDLFPASLKNRTYAGHTFWVQLLYALDRSAFAS